MPEVRPEPGVSEFRGCLALAGIPAEEGWVGSPEEFKDVQSERDLRPRLLGAVPLVVVDAFAGVTELLNGVLARPFHHLVEKRWRPKLQQHLG